MQVTHMHYDFRKYFFCNRIIAVWISLPNMQSLLMYFKIVWIDSAWVNQECKFDWRADIAGIGSRSLSS